MLGSDFVREFAPRGLPSWEAAAFQLAKEGGLTPWPTFDLHLADDRGHTAVLKVATDMLSVGPFEDHVRLPLTPGAAQSILNLTGSLLPTPWLDYQIWRASPFKTTRLKMTPTFNLKDWERHSLTVDKQLAALGWSPGQAATGTKKNVVVSNVFQPKKVLIHGWYDARLPDVFDDRSHWQTPERQPQQVRSNEHADGYVDYSHGIQAVGPMAIVDGQPMRTVDLYQHPTLSSLVSDEGPVLHPRYPSPVPPADTPIAASDGSFFPQGVFVSPNTPRWTLGAMARQGLSEVAARSAAQRGLSWWVR